jgi:hypothetical protein
MLGVDTTLSISETSVNKDRDNFVSDSHRDYPQSRDDGPRQVAFEAELFQPPDAPPEIEYRLTNTGPQRRFYGGAFYPFTGRSESGELLPIPHSNPERTHQGIGPVDPDGPATRAEIIPESPDGGCWRANAGIVILRIGLSVELDKGDTITQRDTILVGPDAPCPPAERQLLTDTLSIGGIHANVTELVAELRLK